MPKMHRVRVTLEVPEDILTNTDHPERALRAVVTAALLVFRIIVVKVHKGDIKKCTQQKAL